MMRTTINLPDDLLREAKRNAAEKGKTLTQTIEDALREVLARKPSPPSHRVKLTTFGKGGAWPHIDLDNSAALLDVMELDDPR